MPKRQLVLAALIAASALGMLACTAATETPTPTAVPTAARVASPTVAPR
jgi:hypothetical protein